MKVVNLNAYRKQRAKAQKRSQADENSVKFGRTKAQKRLETAENEKASREIDNHKRDT